MTHLILLLLCISRKHFQSLSRNLVDSSYLIQMIMGEKDELNMIRSIKLFFFYA
ncbi:hypothetical protein NC653_015953 [Populus alba x Populus x berolinensis]|uniref:Uncharacterized protein n=1 Tax=Populus alba x Populus x berolinensis TaxID=444605 RepID=A0AAD6QLR5_9ROSI|nr:hypothetical protein NC653_015953 [Populus alba x Populus x berolinensis]